MNDISRQTEVSNQVGVIKWFKVYCWVFCFFYLGVMMASLIFFRTPLTELDMPEADANFMGFLFLALGLLSFVAFALPLIVLPRPWVWTYSLVLICLGLTSACSLPLCVPLLIFWLKPEVKRYFGKS